MDSVSNAPPVPSTSERRLRLWPGVVIIVLMWLAIKVPALVMPGTFEAFMVMFNAPMVTALLFALWWLFASRASWADKGVILLFFAVAAVATGFLNHSSVSFFGLILFALPWAMTAWIAWLVITRSLNWPARRIGTVVAFLLVFGYQTLIRMDGVDGSFEPEMSWRWSPTAEDRYLAQRSKNVTQAPTTAGETLTLKEGDWPAFRGPNRDGHVTGVRIATDWKQSPPRELWRHLVGPGWSSFCVVGTRVHTQEQRGDDEVVVCYDAATGKELWAHSDAERFKETVSGPGPRATPTFYNGKIYALGANGYLNCLDAVSGNRIWVKDIKEASGAKVPTWGFSASPLVVQDIVTVFAGGEAGKAVVAYKADTGDFAWSGGDGKLSYCSTHRANIGGVEQVLIATDDGVWAFSPAKGDTVWKHSWPTTEVARVTQPTLVGPADVLIGTGMGVGTRRIHLSQDGSTWKDKELWTETSIKPYFNDLVVFKDDIYGFDGSFFVCVSAVDGKPRWRARGYGSGQVLLLEDQGLLLILSEKGDVALVEAKPEGHHEIAKFKAIEGKTWNHPVLAHGKLFLRNGQEAACYQLQETPTSIASNK